MPCSEKRHVVEEKRRRKEEREKEERPIPIEETGWPVRVAEPAEMPGQGERHGII